MNKAPLLPPKVTGWPVVGSLPELATRHLDFLLEMREKHGDIYRLDFGRAEVIFFGHPRHAQHILVDKGQNYLDKGGMDGFRAGHFPLMGKGLATITGDGSSWKQQRRVMQPYFLKKQLTALTELMIESIESSLDGLEQASQTSAPIDIAQEVTRISMHVIGQTVFGLGISPREADPLADAIREVMDYTWWGTLANMLPAKTPLPRRRSYDRAIDTVHRGVTELVKKSLEADRFDQFLIAQMHPALQELGDEAAAQAYLHIEALTILIAGYESTAASFSWAFHLLNRHPQVMAKLRQEIDAVLQGRAPTAEDLPRLTYTRLVVLEVLRLYAPSYWMQRRAEQADEIDGFHIPAGAIVAPMIHLVHYHPEIWESPRTFDPERFKPERSQGRHKQAWIPFGAGHRRCIAEEFSIVKGQLMLAQILRRYRLAPVSGKEPAMRVGTNVRPQGGVWVRVNPPRYLEMALDPADFVYPGHLP